MLNPEAQEAIWRNSEAAEYAAKFDHVQYDAVEGQDFDVIGYNYDENGILDFAGSHRFTYRLSDLLLTR